jgi:hypothetical protein
VNLGISGDLVTRVSFDFAITLHTDSGNELRLETDFDFIPAIGDPVHIVPANAQEKASVILCLLNARVLSAVANDQNGELAIDFGPAGRLLVPAEGSYEAWALTSQHGLAYNAIAGGGLAAWPHPDR